MISKYKKKFFQESKKSFTELKKRILFSFLALIVFRIGSFVPIPGINTSILTQIIDKQKGTIIEMFNVFSGGAFSRASVFSLGIVPYISASIIIQLLISVYPSLSEIKKEGEIGRRKINKYTRYTTLILAIFQAIGISTGLPNMPGMRSLVINPGLDFYFVAIISLVCGTIFLMWLGEQITEYGIGNGVSTIIFAGIASGLPLSIISSVEQIKNGNLNFVTLFYVSIFIFLVTYFVVFIERGQRRIVVNYAKRQQGRRVYAAQFTHLPLKVNMSGVIPAIFASSVILFPATLASWFGESTKWNLLLYISYHLQPGKLLYTFLYSSAVIFFCFFYTRLVFNSRETADNLKKSGAFIPGIRPGDQTSKHINKIISRLTLIGSIYIAFICLIPEIMRNYMKIPFYFGGTSLLIVVVVIMDFMSQIQTIIMSNQYESILKKAKLKNFNH